MHELAITESILRIAVQAAEEYQAKRVLEIRIKIGAYSGVVPNIYRNTSIWSAKEHWLNGRVSALRRFLQPYSVMLVGRSQKWSGFALNARPAVVRT